MIVDAHHHLWDTTRLHYTLFEALPALNHPFTVQQFQTVARANGVGASVCVEAASAGADGVAEMRWLIEQAQYSSVVRRLVIWAPIERADLGEYLEQVSTLGDGRIAGARRSFEFESPDFPRRDEVIAGVKALAIYGYSFDLVLYHASLPAVLDLVKACPEVQFVLDHSGKPDIRGRLEHPWREQLAELARRPNVACKISGLPTEADRSRWKPEELKPYIDHVIECFGWDRVLFGSDWPVCRLAGGYERWLAALNWAIAGAGEPERRKLFAENARRIYRL